jgi:hypothetical protein
LNGVPFVEQANEADPDSAHALQVFSGNKPDQKRNDLLHKAANIMGIRHDVAGFRVINVRIAADFVYFQSFPSDIKKIGGNRTFEKTPASQKPKRT